MSLFQADLHESHDNEKVTNILSTIGVFSNLLALMVGFVLVMLAFSVIYNQYNEDPNYKNKLTSFYGLIGLIFFTIGSGCAAFQSYYFMSFNETYTIFGQTIDRWAFFDICYFFCADIGQVSIYLFLINRLKNALHGMSRKVYVIFNILSIINLLLGFYGICIIFEYQSYDIQLSNQNRLILSDVPIFSGLVISGFLTFIIIYLFITKTLQIIIEHKLHHTFDDNNNNGNDNDNNEEEDAYYNYSAGGVSPAFSHSDQQKEISIMTMSSDLFDIERSQESILNTTATIIVISFFLLLVSILYLIYVLIWYLLYEITADHERFRHMREFAVLFSGFMAIIDNLCIYISLDPSNKWYQCFCGCFHSCWISLAINYTKKHVQELRHQKQPFLSSRYSNLQTQTQTNSQ